MFDFLYVVGRGGFGKVWMVKYKKTHEKYALKEMSKVKIIDRKSEKSIKNEREFLSKLHHPFIVNMICSFQDYENLYLVMDLLTGGDLRYHICHKKQFNEEQSRFFSSCILLALEYIHMNNIIHRDIKPENLVLDEKGYVRVTDFGVAKKNTRDNSSETSGTPGYMAPEVLCGLNHSFSVDFFALGVIVFEFMNGYRPYLGRNRKEIKEAVLARQIHVHRKQLFENGWSFESGDLINKLLYRKPHKRLGCNGIKEIKEHSWFKNINWEELLNKKMKSPFVPKDGDNFDKRYCEGIEPIDTQTKERYQYYKSKSKFRTLFLNYTFIREEDKQEYNESISSNINSTNINSINSMTNIHSFSILNNKNNRNKNANSYFNQIDKENNDDNLNIIYNENEDEDQKIFSRTFKVSKNNRSAVSPPPAAPPRRCPQRAARGPCRRTPPRPLLRHPFPRSRRTCAGRCRPCRSPQRRNGAFGDPPRSRRWRAASLCPPQTDPPYPRWAPLPHRSGARRNPWADIPGCAGAFPFLCRRQRIRCP